MDAVNEPRAARPRDLSVRSYAKFVARHRWIIAAFVAVGLIVGLVLASRQPSVVSAVSRVVLTPQESVVTPNEDLNALHLVSLDSDAQLLSSSSVLSVAAASLSWPATASSLADGLNVSAVPNSRVLIVRYDNPVATRATTGCDAIVLAFLQARAAAAQERSATARGILEQQITDLTSRLVSLQTVDAGLHGVAVVADKLEEAQLNNRLDDLRKSLAELPSAATDPGVVVSPARRRGDPTRPMAGATVATGALVGLVGGLIGGKVADQPILGLRRRRVRPASHPRDARRALVGAGAPRQP